MTAIGEESSEQFDIIPAKLRVLLKLSAYRSIYKSPFITTVE
ncbi:hypothetical protein [Haliea atlantica]